MREENILFNNHTALYNEFLQFEQKIISLAAYLGLILSDYEIDHIAVRVNNCKTAKSYLELFVKYGVILSDNIVNGRVIYLIKLHQPLVLAGQKVQIIELPFPNGKIYPQESWEHIEIVTPFLAKESTIEWIERIKKQFLLNQMSELSVKVDEPKVDGEILPNPSIALSFADKTQNHSCIKVHPYSIEEIIEVNLK